MSSHDTRLARRDDPSRTRSDSSKCLDAQMLALHFAYNASRKTHRHSFIYGVPLVPACFPRVYSSRPDFFGIYKENQSAHNTTYAHTRYTSLPVSLFCRSQKRPAVPDFRSPTRCNAADDEANMFIILIPSKPSIQSFRAFW